MQPAQFHAVFESPVSNSRIKQRPESCLQCPISRARSIFKKAKGSELVTRAVLHLSHCKVDSAGEGDEEDKPGEGEHSDVLHNFLNGDGERPEPGHQLDPVEQLADGKINKFVNSTG